MQSKSILMALVVSLCAATLLAQPQPPPAPWRGAGAAPCISSDGGIYKCAPAPRVYRRPRRTFVRQQDRPDADAPGGAALGRAHHRSRRRGSSEDPCGSRSDRPAPGHRPARLDRRAYAHVQCAQARRHHGSRHAAGRPERAKQSARGLHRGARHEHSRQRLRRHRRPRRHQPRRHRRPPLSGIDARHRVGRQARRPLEARQPARQHRGSICRRRARRRARRRSRTARIGSSSTRRARTPSRPTARTNT